MTYELREPSRPTEVPPAAIATPSTAAADGSASPIDDPRALTILTTEHWNLLTARSLVYNEAFARAGMFLAFLSATLVVLGLISAMAGLNDAFLLIAALVLALDLFIGLATLGRISAASDEDLRYLQGMNRLRRAYFDMVPGLEPYFITSPYDDFASVAAFYGPTNSGAIRGVLHGMTTAPGMIGVICSAVAGGETALISYLISHDALLATIGGLAGFIVLFVLISVLVVWNVGAFIRDMEVKFPRPSTGPSPRWLERTARRGSEGSDERKPG